MNRITSILLVALLSQAVLTADISYLTQNGEHDWNYYDQKLRHISATLDMPSDEFVHSKLAEVDRDDDIVTFIYDFGNGKGDEVVFEL